METAEVRCPACGGKMYYNKTMRAFVCRRCYGKRWYF